ncbi:MULTISPECIES: hypothetical protein [unclassified Nocardioides]|uniref:hypothetical protein n=1 Tax=unclassified Nocardioides TaxID=2615069 RepID=UPI003609255A
MTRTRLAAVLGVVAVLAVVATGAIAVATRDGDEPGRAGSVVVTDPESGASFQVPGMGWRLRAADSRISYGPVHVDGPALLDEGYCKAQPKGSFRALAGFTDQSFDAWVSGVMGGAPTVSTGTSAEDVVLADGTPATFRWTGLLGPEGPCAASGIEVAMIRAGDVRAVVVADSGDAGTLSPEKVPEILLTLSLDTR